MNEIPFDVETTTINKGNPYNKKNKLVSIGLLKTIYYKKFNVPEIQKYINQNYLIGHNIKFDIAWLRTIGIDFSTANIRDTQLAEFLITNQTHAYASLEELSIKYLNEHKIDIIKNEYWDKGIDTWFIPEDLLAKYLEQDLNLTYKIWKKQKQILQETNKWNLFLLQCKDLLVLQDIEWNGILFNKEESLIKGKELNEILQQLKNNITKYSLYPEFNINSGDHLSCLLYGGTIIHTDKVPVGVFKMGQKIGQIRYKNIKVEYKQERLVEPLKGSELKKEGYYSTDKNTLISLKPKTKEIRKLIKDILEYSRIEKLQSTYYFGIPKKMDEFGWIDNYIHSSLNQVVARTGRLSSSEPNQQNFDPNIKRLCYSRYD